MKVNDPNEIVKHRVNYIDAEDGNIYSFEVDIPRHLSEYITSLLNTLIEQDITYENLEVRYELITGLLNKQKQN